MDLHVSHITRPGHVPADRIIDFDIYNVKVENGDYQLALKTLHDPGMPEIMWTPYYGGHWLVTRPADIDTVLSDYAHFSTRHNLVPKVSNDAPPLLPQQVDPPEHMKYRALLVSALSTKAVGLLSESARELAISLIEGFKDRGECEFMSEFAHHLPIAIFMKIVNLPEEDKNLVVPFVNAWLRGQTEEIRTEGRMKMDAYGLQKVRERRINPGTDLISTIATAKVDGAFLDDAALTGIISQVLGAGLDTVASMLGYFAMFLAGNPEHRRELIDDPSRVPNAVEELLRRYPIAVLAREVKEDFTFGGVTLKKGDMVVAPTALDGLDERKLDQPLEVNFKRPNPIRHATFGAGVHRCMGAMLARMELRVFLEEWLKRIPDFSVKPNADIKVVAGAVVIMTALPLVWERS
jgi:cytochrome P450